jgi:membrane protein DedA with SNARE-associated domain
MPERAIGFSPGARIAALSPIRLLAGFLLGKQLEMHDQLAGWVGDIIAGVNLVLIILQLRRHRRDRARRRTSG